MAYETIIVEVEDHIAKVTLNRPDALNALNDQLMSELAEAMAAAQADPKVRCIVLTGSEKAFAAGADIAMMKAPIAAPSVDPRPPVNALPPTTAAMMYSNSSPSPVLA